MNYKNTKTQVDAGLGQAIAYFTGLGSTVSLPLTDNQAYDLIVDDEIGIHRVQVKTSKHKKNKGENAGYCVVLSTQGGNRSWDGTIKKLDATKIDLVFIYLENGDRYLFPSSVLDGKASIVLYSKWYKYKI